ncbi:pirin domain-containing protein [Laetiporus sulphureus 93-53]|uniref:Pirin domain-containing protein n=1 Tax=Laetiporus sulphureus 93-53 TaxID=1314785 RepID=A0A165EQL6_9APHY|nr:pirin domain-containing protein [Laetiporus sulphureus 93-53]KZT07559.1 pirin domain-containing protein [Laetiporus sulphureus 93-53]
MTMKAVPRLSHERGHADHGWLKTFHTFSFAMYHDSDHEQFGCLRVLNEDRVEPGTGFGTHGHREFEIFSYVVSGQLEHRDSMGNLEILKRGDLQMTSAGTGIRHSEKCYGEQVHFLQIWSMPSQSGLTPTYYTRHFTDEEKRDKWVRVVTPAGESGVSEARAASGPAPVHSPLSLYASLLSPAASLSHTFPTARTGTTTKAYIHVVQTSGYNPEASSGARVKISGGDTALELSEGDGAYIMGEAGKGIQVENIGDSTAEVLLFDVE